MASRGSDFNVPMHVSDFSVIDSEFNSIRERFDAEMRKMEDEMSRFRSELLNRESSSSVIHKSSTTQSQRMSEKKTTEVTRSRPPGSEPKRVSEQRSMQESRTWVDGQETSHTSSDFSSSTTNVDSAPTPPPQHRSEVRTWLDGLDSPLIKEGQETDGKCLQLRFDVSQYKPEEIVVKTVDNKLQVHAKHEEKSETRSVYREYNREFLLPKGTNPELIRSTLSKDGVLTVEAPLPQPAITAGEKSVRIEHQ